MKPHLATWAVASLLALGPEARADLVVIDPDAFAAGTVLGHAFPGVTLTALEDPDLPGVLLNADVVSVASPFASTGTRVFGNVRTGGSTSAAWGGGAFSALRVDFAGGATRVSLDFIPDDDDDNNPFLNAFNSSGTLVAFAITGSVPLGTVLTLTVSHPDIAYVIASWDDAVRIDSGALDNLRYEPAGAVIPEPASVILLGLGSLGLVGCRRRRKRSARRREGAP